MEVRNDYGVAIDYDMAVAMMDCYIMEQLHNEIAPCTEQEFFDAYADAHERKYREEWELAKENPVY